MANEITVLSPADEELLNSLSDMAAACAEGLSPFSFGQGDQLSQADTLFKNNRWYLLSNLRQLLTQLYVEHGVIQTLCDQPVDDAFRAGFEVKSGQLDGDDIEQLILFEERTQCIASLMQAKKWARLYGGGGVMIITDQDPATPLDMNKITKDSPLAFRDCDMWELYWAEQNVQATPFIGGALGENQGDFYDYYGVKVHKSRVYIVKGKKCPSFLRPRLRGWGMSELEKIVRSLNQYLKNQDVLFSLLDEAKIDVHRIKGLTASLINKNGSQLAARRIQMANAMKNYNNALVMDKEDEYQQKQISFSGLGDVLLQIRQGLAADLKMPMTKLFGISAAGFSSGEDDIENYNAMLESEIRKPCKFQVVDLLQICCQKVFGDKIEDLMITFNPLRILNADEEENVKDKQHNRVMATYNAGLMRDDEAQEAINKGSLLPIDIDADGAAFDVREQGGNSEDADAVAAKGGSDGKKAKQIA